VATAETAFLWRRLYLRKVVAAHLGVDPASVPLGWRCHRCGDGDHGRPVLAGPASLSVSAASSEDVVAVAVARGATVGVDIESVRPGLPATDLLAALSPAERTQLSTGAGSPAEASRRALMAFVRKEALLKLEGTGLSRDPRRLHVGTAPVVHGWQATRSRAGYWADVDAGALEGYVGALAMSRQPAALNIVIESIGGDHDSWHL